MSQNKEVTLRLTEEELKSLDTLACLEEERLDRRRQRRLPTGRGVKVRAAAVAKIRKAARSC